MTAALTPDRRAVLRRRVRLLVAVTISYNVVEAVVALTAGTLASSVALVGFGLDSVIEVSSAAAVAWQFAGSDPQRRERTALRVIAWSFFALAAYVSVEAVRALLGGGEAERSTVGIALVALSVVVMPCLSLAQRRAGRELGRPARSRTPSRRCCARTCRRRCWSAWCSTPRSAGGGPTRWRRWCWPRWLSKKAGRRGAETCAAHRRRELVRRTAGAPTAAARDQGEGSAACRLRDVGDGEADGEGAEQDP